MVGTKTRRGIAGLLIGIALCGCNYMPGAGGDLDDDFADLELDEELELDSDAAENKPRKSLLDELESAAAAESEDEPPEPKSGELGLRLAVGDQFPLRKTLEQRLTQSGPTGPVTGSSRVDLLLSLRVEELRDGQTRLGVRYHNVRYREQDLEGRRVEYDSTQLPKPIPPQALAYAGLVNNGFSFWVGPDNRLMDIVGFKDFVERCVQNVPLAHRQAVMAQLSAANGENGVASFIDDSIGLLPVGAAGSRTGVAVREGTSWDRVRRLEGPIPMQVALQCMIKSLTEKTAEINLAGAVSPTQQIAPQHGWKVAVLGGRCLGSCTVDRRTGIPTNSVMQRYVDLQWQMPDGAQLTQRKEILTKVTAYLNQEPQMTGFGGSAVTPTAHQILTGPPAETPRR
jgi:hypothetical protein